MLALLASLAPSLARAQLGTSASLPVEVPSRPFLLVDAPERFTPSEPASVRVQLSEGGEARVSVLRLDDPRELLGQAGRRQGVSVAHLPIGERSERLIAASGPLPRRGEGLTLMRDEPIVMPRPGGPRVVGHEPVVYDSNEDVEDDVATYWVQTGSWSVRRVDLGRLPVGLYLVEVRAGAWMSSTLLSVGQLVLLARRGDRGDLVRVSGPDGAPKRGVLVEARAGGRVLARARTGAQGLARLPAQSAQEVRFVARRGEDLAWADVSALRLRPCDPRVYVATGRPVYRDGERMFVRGHVRGCERDRFAPLAGRTVHISSGGRSVDAVTDADGNFVAELRASGEIAATLDGQPHLRDVQIDHRALPEVPLVVEPDRRFAATGQPYRVRVASPEGGWPRVADVVLTTPAGRLVQAIGPGQPAVFDLAAPPTDEVLERVPLRASVVEPGRITMGSSELWVGRSPLSLALDAGRERGRVGEPVRVQVSGADLSGGSADGPVEVALYGTDGNRRLGRARGQADATLRDGHAEVGVVLSGEGPWWIEARRGPSRAHQIVWARARPPSLASRGPLTVRPEAARTRPGEPLRVDLRIPPRGRAWLTLEQGGVLWSTTVEPGRTSATVPVPDAARGLATLALTHVAGGRVDVSTASVEVETSRPVRLTARTDRRLYDPSETARVHVEAKDDEGAPRDAVVSLWLADEGYWSLGEERYPLPGPYFALPGRPAAAGDSSRPVSFGAEEGRRLDSELLLDRRPVARSTHRHAWGFGGRLVSLSERGSLDAVWSALARAAGVEESRTHCPDDAGAHELQVRQLPWDLVATRVGEALGGEAWLEEGRLTLDCTGASGHGSGLGAGRGAGSPRIRSGSAGLGLSREERLEGTLHFIGLRRLGPDGRVDLDVPLPAQPGRWRVEVLAIADDGGGARAHQSLSTTAPLEARLDGPRRLAVGDRAVLTVRARARSLAGRALPLAVQLPSTVRASGAAPRTITLDAGGRGEVTLEVEAIEAGDDPVSLAVGDAGLRDAVRARLEVASRETRRDLVYAALLGPTATEIDLPLPPLARAIELTVAEESQLTGGVERAIEELRGRRWDFAHARADRLDSLMSLRRALGPDARGSRRILREEIDRAIAGELSHLRSLRTSSGALGWGDRVDPALTFGVLLAARAARVDRGAWRQTESAARTLAREGPLGALAAARALALFGPDLPAARVRALRDAARGGLGDVEARIAFAEASEAMGDAAAVALASRDLADLLTHRLATPPPANACPPAVWFPCGLRRGDRATVARAASALLRLGHPRGRRLAAEALAWIARVPARPLSRVTGSGDAEVLELLGALGGRGARIGGLEVRVDGRRVSAPGGRVRVPAGTHRVSLRAATRDGRFARLVVRGPAELAEPRATLGNAGLTRAIIQQTDGWALVLRFRLARAEHGVTVDAPVSSAFAVDARGLDGVEVTPRDGGARLRWSELAAGDHTITVPLLASGARGRFVAGSAQLMSDDGLTWAVTPSLAVGVDPARPGAVATR